MKWMCVFLFLVVLSACSNAGSNQNPDEIVSTAAAVSASLTPPEAEFTPSPKGIPSGPELECDSQAISVPSLPEKIPAKNELDATTGLHMTGIYQQIDLETYRLKVSGNVDHPLSLTYGELRCLPKVTATADLVCPGYFQDRATWSGVPILEVLRLAGVQTDMQKVTIVSADGYNMFIPAEDALNPKNFLAYELEGSPLPILHGFPLRAVFPGQVGGWWVKWLVELIVQ